jgi:UDP-2,3-diacylglucosamine pyrophosphatase LpxH
LHLGFRGAKAKNLLAFLKSIECDYLYLVGDIFDLWAMKSKVFWNDDCNAVVRRILKMAKNGTKVVYIVGNHDEAVRSFIPLTLGEIEVCDETTHVMLDGTELLLIHGDIFDFVAKWLSILGSHIYDRLIVVNNWLHKLRVGLGFKKYWSLSNFLKQKTKRAMSAIRSFEAAVIHYAKKKGKQGVICGHIHTFKLDIVDGMIYGNCGDWVESLTAIVETVEGKLEEIHWHDLTHAGFEDVPALATA